MPTNILSPTWMNDTLSQEFSNVKKLGFTAEGVNKIFQAHSRSETNFTKAARAISSNEKLIEAIYTSCPGIKPTNLEKILSKKGNGCAAVIEKLHSCRKDIDGLMKMGKFSGASISGMISGSFAAAIAGLDALANKKSDFQILIDSGFSASNLSSLLKDCGSHLNASIQALIDNSSKFDSLKKIGFSENNISSILKDCGANFNASIQALIDNSSTFDSLKKIGFSENNISSILNGSGVNLKDSIKVLIKNKANLEHLISLGFSVAQISSLLNASGISLSQNILALIKHSGFFLGSLQSGQCSALALRPELRKYAAQIGESINSAPQVEQAAEVVAADDFAGSSVDEFMADLAGLLLLAPNCSGDQFLPATAALVKHRNTLLQLHTWCGFSANHIAGILNHSEANLGKAIGELSGKAILLFGLIQEGHFTAGELAEKLHGSGDSVGEVFGKDPAIRDALHASHCDLNGERTAPSLAQEADLFNDAQFFEVDDSDISLSSFSLDKQIHMPPVTKRPRFD